VACVLRSADDPVAGGIRTAGRVSRTAVLKTAIFAGTPTRLKGMSDELRMKLMSWGYAVCDAAIRKHMTLTGKRRPRSRIREAFRFQPSGLF